MTYTNKEAIQLLRTRLKPYLHIKPSMPQPKFSKTCTHIELSMAKPSTAKAFLYLFGFEGTYDAWVIDVNNWGLKSKKA